MTSTLKSALLSATIISVSGLGTPAFAATIFALTGDKTIIRIDVDTARVLSTVAVTNGPSRLASIDIRPANRTLYGLFSDGRTARIQARTGSAFLGPIIEFDFSNAIYNIDFNPVVDRLRIVGSNDVNLRANVDDGTFMTDAPIAGPMPNPFGDPSINVVAVSYTNSFGAPAGDATAGTAPPATQLYDIDRNPAALYLQVPPNNGTLSAVGRLQQMTFSFGFEIVVDEAKRNRGYIVTSNRLLEIDLAGGATISNRPIQGLNAPVRDMTILSDFNP